MRYVKSYIDTAYNERVSEFQSAIHRTAELLRSIDVKTEDLHNTIKASVQHE